MYINKRRRKSPVATTNNNNNTYNSFEKYILDKLRSGVSQEDIANAFTASMNKVAENYNRDSAKKTELINNYKTELIDHINNNKIKDRDLAIFLTLYTIDNVDEDLSYDRIETIFKEYNNITKTATAWSKWFD